MFHCQEIASPPDLLALHRFKPDNYPYLLASNTLGDINSRYSILMAYPESTSIQRSGEGDCLKLITTDLTNRTEHTELPFIGGWFIFLSYEYASIIEPSVRYYPEKSELPLALISRIPAAIIIDHEHNTCFIVSVENRQTLIHKIRSDIQSTPKLKVQASPQSIIEEENPAIYRDYLQRTHQYIVDGDIFQANLSRLWTVQYQRKYDVLNLYRNLRRHNPSPFSALIKMDDYYILSSSPERLVCVVDGVVETRPIAGTHPRGDNEEEDRQLSDMLLKHPKERAEHVMLIDLERNDLGRICQPGTIRVKDNMILETYSHVHHIVSRITGSLQPDKTVRDVLHAVFPGGTITGCPKVRCMEIISELEQAPRGAYTGSLGYISDHGHMDMNILIRTMTCHSDRIQFRAGAGIVSDSITDKELNETRHKAKGMLNAIQSDL